MPRRPLAWAGAPAAPIPARLSGVDGVGEVFAAGDSAGVSLIEEQGFTAVLLGGVYDAGDEALPLGFVEHLRRDLEGALRVVEGSFALVWVATRPGGEAVVHLATDRYGFRPLFYCEREGELLFATHLSGLHRMLGTLPPPSPSALLHYYHFGVTSNRESLLQGIRKVPPGTVLTVRPGAGMAEARYFDPLDLYDPAAYAHLGEDEAARLVDERMTASVARRAQGGGRIAIALSGGVDSGFIAKKLHEVGADFQAFNLAYGGYYDEHDRVDHIGRSLGVPVTRLSVSAPEVIASFEAANGIGSEPVPINDAALRLLARQARAAGADTLWDGDGADRLFLGMNSHLKYSRMVRLFGALRRAHLVVPALTLLGRLGHPEARKLRVVLQNWIGGIPPYPERRYEAVGAYDAAYEQAVFDLGVGAACRRFEERVGESDFGALFTYLSVLMCPEKFFHAPGELQGALGLRPVSAYWDDGVVGVAFSLPTRLKIHGGKTKHVLRKAAALGGSTDYWMLPKVGLQSALGFLRQTAEGQAWLEERYAQVAAAEEYAFLSEEVKAPSPERLLPYLLWKEGHEALA